jgi:hypothetical protein
VGVKWDGSPTRVVSEDERRRGGKGGKVKCRYLLVVEDGVDQVLHVALQHLINIGKDRDRRRDVSGCFSI